MTSPARVAVTGAAGQIGYSLLFRIASRRDAGAGPAGGAEPDGDHAGARRAPGRGHGTRRLRVSAASGCRGHRRSGRRVQGCRLRDARRSEASRKGGWNAGTCSPRTGESSCPQGRALNDHASRDVKVLVIGNPANTNAPHRDAQRAGSRAGAVLRDDPARPQPRHQPGGGEDRRRGERHFFFGG